METKKLEAIMLPTEKQIFNSANKFIVSDGKQMDFIDSSLTPIYYPKGFKSQYLYLVSDEIKEGDKNFFFIELDLNGKRSSYTNKVYFCDAGVTENFILTSEINFPFPENCRKIIATTNDEVIKMKESYSLFINKVQPVSLIQQSDVDWYVSEYNKGNVIKEVNIECKVKSTVPFSIEAPDRDRGYIDVIKTNPDNTVIILKNTDMFKRASSMSWWNTLSSLRKTQLCDTNTDLVGSIRRYETLTGREIQSIWEKENKKESLKN